MEHVLFGLLGKFVRFTWLIGCCFGLYFKGLLTEKEWASFFSGLLYLANLRDSLCF